MLLKLLLTLLLDILGFVTSLFAGLIPSFPAGFDGVVTQVRNAITSGASIVLYFFDVTYVKALLTMVLGYWVGIRAYNLVLKILVRTHIVSGAEDDD